jgi:colanic acid/amylovoran biosynthesis glycosyltransferase
MRIAYLINQYPAVSHSFIRREILALERLGFDVFRVSIRGWNDALADPQDKQERERTHYALKGGAVPLATAVLRMLVTRPAGMFKALSLAWHMSRHSERGFLFHLAYLAEASRIVPWLRDAKAEHVHAHFGTNSAEVAMLVHALGGPTWSFTVHGPTEFQRPRFIGLADKIRHSAFVVAISSFGRSQLYLFSDHRQWPKVKVVHCGLDADYFSGPATPPPSARRLVCVGRLTGQKGQSLLVEAAARLRARAEDFELVLAGDGEMRPAIEALIAQHDLKSCVRITGWLSGDQVRREIEAARALVLPSFAEGLPVVLMEAMALHRPVISTFVAGIPELVQTGEHGWLVPAGDIDALEQAMRDCLNAPAADLARMGAAAFTRVQQRHNVDTEAAKLAALFREVARHAEQSV